MRRQDINYIVSFLLLVSLAITAITGYIQAQLELRGFVPHQYFAYITLALAVIHVFFNAGKLWRYIRGKFKRKTFFSHQDTKAQRRLGNN